MKWKQSRAVCCDDDSVMSPTCDSLARKAVHVAALRIVAPLAADAKDDEGVRRRGASLHMPTSPAGDSTQENPREAFSRQKFD